MDTIQQGKVSRLNSRFFNILRNKFQYSSSLCLLVIHWSKEIDTTDEGTQQYQLTAKCWSVKSGKKGGFMSNPDTKHYFWIGSSNQYTQNKQQYMNISFISIWTNIMSYISMLFNKNWCGCIIKIIIGLVQVLIINYAFIHILLKCRSQPPERPD